MKAWVRAKALRGHPDGYHAAMSKDVDLLASYWTISAGLPHTDREHSPFDFRERAGLRVCEGMAKRGVLTRPIGNVIVLMPPYCTTAGQVQQIVTVLHDSIEQSVARLGKSRFNHCRL